jgi:hypothetical protein
MERSRDSATIDDRRSTSARFESHEIGHPQQSALRWPVILNLVFDSAIFSAHDNEQNHQSFFIAVRRTRELEFRLPGDQHFCNSYSDADAAKKISAVKRTNRV